VARSGLIAAILAMAHASVPGTASTAWSGTFTLSGATPVAIAVLVDGSTATVSLGPGHASGTQVKLARSGFSLPGLPDDLVFTGTPTTTGAVWSGKVSQGPLHGTFVLRPRPAPAVSALGVYRSARGSTVAIVQARGFPAWLVELPSGATHGLNLTLMTVGAALGRTSGDGTLTLHPATLAWHGTRYTRVPLRQWEVRVGRTAGTLTMPAGRGPFAAAVMVHGSEESDRSEFQVFAAYLASLGIATLAADKEGSSLAELASEAARQVDFVASRPGIDRTRVGLLGDSQAGWTIALAAANDRRVRWAVPLVGPTTTVGETDLFTALAGAEQRPPAESRAAMLKEVEAAGRSGFDPLPSLRRLSIPVLWVYGDDDRNVPTELCVRRLESIRRGHRFSWVVLHMTHALIELPNGLYSSLPASRGFTPTLFPTVGAWLRRVHVRR
jgi:hypothetical protein